ncbi:hypothetical protein OZ664_11915 [Elizabethkingia sp. HX WHF]|uniref:Uncharacterized protein n=2 Tax=Elizabethkingia TaxID=308865 RepID=A0ABY3NAI1_ELIMR|nr:MULTISPECIES: hypothetical protein [Elizabethkingia]AQX00473.1 hypothetical protein BBD32_02820 [Elizabethkingia anophelis]MCT4190269.1 hypothetical protein [Elizabethkingia anophelis]MCT4288684.1 hypothetical protein [Elizabethkingia anophelis]MDV3585581.1 hypothetical protein [Elizabethkingia anophelis]MDV3751152.1 hypothetical protein [Elizabethkingia anophelis]
MNLKKFTSEELALIKEHTSTDEKREAALKHGYVIDTVNAVIRKDRRITEENQNIFRDLLRIAKKNKKNVLQAE